MRFLAPRLDGALQIGGCWAGRHPAPPFRLCGPLYFCPVCFLISQGRGEGPAEAQKGAGFRRGQKSWMVGRGVGLGEDVPRGARWPASSGKKSIPGGGGDVAGEGRGGETVSSGDSGGGGDHDPGWRHATGSLVTVHSILGPCRLDTRKTSHEL